MTTLLPLAFLLGLAAFPALCVLAGLIGVGVWLRDGERPVNQSEEMREWWEGEA